MCIPELTQQLEQISIVEHPSDDDDDSVGLLSADDSVDEQTSDGSVEDGEWESFEHLGNGWYKHEVNFHTFFTKI